MLLERGHEVTVWNRSDSERAAALEAAGARRAASPAAAAAAAPLVLMCVTDYPAADEVLAAPGVLDALAGRDFVQFTNGTEAAGASAARDWSAAPAPACSPAPSPPTRGTSAGRRR